MKKILLAFCCAVLSAGPINAQCTFESLFPLKWGASTFAFNEHFQNDSIFRTSEDTIRGSAFEHGQNYFFTARNMKLGVYSYQSFGMHPCFRSGKVIVNGVANDSGLVAYNYQVTYPAAEKAMYMAVLDSMKAMMSKKFGYNSTVKNPTKSMDAEGNLLTGEGVSVYYNNEPIISSNLTYPQFVIRAGYLGKKPAKSSDSTLMNQAEDVQYYLLEILYKFEYPKW
jgi:hypothetical protein